MSKFRTIWTTEDRYVEVIDQRKLPHEFVTVRLETYDEAEEAIKDMTVRGAPLIGATAAYGIYLAVREMIEAFGAFIEVHVATSIDECERRDRKGLYKLAREGKIKEFTGISDPYEAPTTAELVVDTQDVDVDHCAHQVILKLESMGLIRA